MLDDRAPAHAMVFSRILRKGQLNRHTRYRPNVPTSRLPLPHETLPRSGRVTRWTNTPVMIFKDPDHPPVPASPRILTVHSHWFYSQYVAEGSFRGSQGKAGAPRSNDQNVDVPQGRVLPRRAIRVVDALLDLF